MLQYVHHIEYLVHDRDAIVDYFQKTFGLTPTHLEINRKGREAHFMVGKTQIQILEPADSYSDRAKRLAEHGPMVTHVAWAIDNFQELATKLGNTCEIHKSNSTKSHDYQAININPEFSHGVTLQLVDVAGSGDA